MTKRKHEENPNAPLNLCERCRDIKYEHALDPRLPMEPSGLLLQKLGKPGPKNFKGTCPLCQLLLSVAPRYKRRYTLVLRVLPTTLMERARRDTGRQQGFGEAHRVLVVTRQYERQPSSRQSMAREVGSRGFLDPVSHDPTSDCHAQTIDSEAIPYDLLTGWINTCNTSHRKTHCTNILDRDDRLAQLRVLDCSTQEVVLLPRDSRYFALSYVWGASKNGPLSAGSTTETIAKDGEFLSHPGVVLPLTIQDAMQVVLNMGYRYLWVDKYCIDQADSTKQQQAFAQMHKIYSKAELTIITLYGEDSSAGLPGVSSVPRQGNHLIRTLEGQLLSSLPTLDFVVERSVWATRGWTYQESRLSCRCLFFTADQIYFYCRGAILSEALPLRQLRFLCHDSPSPEQAHLTMGLDPSALSAAADETLQHGLFLDRFTYSKKALTHQYDKLNAFRGILNAHPIYTLWGVPIIPRTWNLDPCIGFAMGLLWTRQPTWAVDDHIRPRVKDSSLRIPGFPTWSWASTSGVVFQQMHGARSLYGKYVQPPSPRGLEIASDTDPSAMDPCGLSDPARITPKISVSLMDPEILLSDAIRSTTHYMLPESSRSLLVEGEIVTVKTLIRDSQFCDQEGNPVLGIPSISREYDLDISHADVKQREYELQDALILIEWNDDQPQTECRFVLMLLRWVDEGVAEREGLLGEYKDSWKVDQLRHIPRRRAKFLLQ